MDDKELIEALQRIIDKEETTEEDRKEAEQLIDDLRKEVQ